MSGQITLQEKCFSRQIGKSRLQVSGQIMLQVLCQQTDREEQVTGVRADNVTGIVSSDRWGRAGYRCPGR